MTTVTFFKSGGELVGFRAQGHAEYVKDGEDIVCAAVSALCQTAELGARRVAKAKIHVRIDERKALFELLLAENPQEAIFAAQVILRTLEEGILDIEQQYSGFVRTTYTERRQTS